MVSKFRHIPFLTIALTLVACSTVQVGQNFDLHSLEGKIERGVTTKNQVQVLLGNPTSVGISADPSGESFNDWTYYYASGKLPSLSDSKVKLLQLKFDSQGIVRGYNWSSSEK
jgi:outer membrane protein assembly factor BamE (lipoprotein component of BamABCDE complex)